MRAFEYFTATDSKHAVALLADGASDVTGQIFGVRYLATLSGMVFFSHQVGSFLGVWLGGRLYDIYGTYDVVWWGGVALALFAAAINLPINDRTVERRVSATA